MNAQIRAKIDTGFAATGTDGRPLRIALLDDGGRVVADGRDVAGALFAAAIEAQNNFWEGRGHLTAVRPVFGPGAGTVAPYSQTE